MFENKRETFPEREKRIIEFWDSQDILEKTVQNRKKDLSLAFMMDLHLPPVFLIMDTCLPEQLKMSSCAIKSCKAFLFPAALDGIATASL